MVRLVEAPAGAERRDMEWVERTDRTVEAAKDFLLDQLGVDESEAEFEILEEPKPGLFGRVRGQARVRARVAPRAPRPKEDRRRRGRARGEGRERSQKQTKAQGSEPAARTDQPPKEKAAVSGGNGSATRAEVSPPADPEQFVEPVTSFLTGVVNAFDLPAEVSVSVASDGALEAELTGTQLGALIGPSGGVIEALRELTRTFLQKEAHGQTAPRVRIDVGGYREGRREALSAFAARLAEDVRATGATYVLEVMGSADRKVVHDTIAELDGVVTRSEGEDPDRRVAIAPAE